jgi:type IV secretion system protein VirD4
MNSKKDRFLLAAVAAYVLFTFFLYFAAGQPLSVLTPVYFLRSYGFSLWWADAGLVLSVSAGFLLLILMPVKLKNYGDAHFATRSEVKKMGLFAKTGLILGRKGFKYVRTDKPLSVLVFAPPGSGKTAGVIIPSLLSCSNSMIIHDPKGELHEKTSKRRGEFSKIVRFAPGEENSMRWNPLAKAELPDGWEGVQAVVDRIANSFITAGKYSASGDDYWIREARSLFSFWALYLIHKNGETCFAEILKEMFVVEEDSEDSDFGRSAQQEKIINIIKTAVPDRLKIEGAGLAGKAYKEFSGMVGTCKSYLQVFLDETVAKNTSVCDFSIKKLRQERTTIYLMVKASDQTRLKPLLSLFFETAALQLIENKSESADFNVTFMLDEFKRLNRMQEVLELPSISRSYRVNAVFVVQSLSQIDEIYGKAGTDQLRNTCAYHVVFAQNEFRIAESVSKSIGTKTRIKKSKNFGSTAPSVFSKNSRSQSMGTGETQEGIPLIRPQEIMSLKKNKILILSQNHFQTPVKASVCLWFKIKIMKGMIEK